MEKARQTGVLSPETVGSRLRTTNYRLQTAFAVVITAALLLTLGFHRAPGETAPPAAVREIDWQSVVTTVATLSACQGEPAVTARNYVTLDALPDANCTIVEVDPRARYAEIGFQIDADGNTATILALLAPHRYDPGSGENRDAYPRFTRAWSFAITGGAQTGPNSNVFADTIVATQYTPSVGVVSDSAGNYRCRFDVDLRGVTYLAFVRTDSDANLTTYVDVRWY
jgi:hypothetical protein